MAGNSGTAAPNVDGTITSQATTWSARSARRATDHRRDGRPVGVSDASVALGPLQNNGGTTPTHALLAGSIAIDKGHSSGSTTDRAASHARATTPAIANATGGDGADVGAFEERAGGLQQFAARRGRRQRHDLEDSGANTIGVLANDTDANGDTLTITAVTQGAHGSVVNNGTSVSYTPNPNFFGSDSFTYTIDDGHGATDTATVNVTVLNVEDPPTAVDDSATIAEDSGANTINVLANDSDVDGDALAVTAVTQGAHGSVANNGTSVSYTPAHDFFGSDSFTYTIGDGNGGTDTATVHVTVTNVNDPPVARRKRTRWIRTRR